MGYLSIVSIVSIVHMFLYHRVRVTCVRAHSARDCGRTCAGTTEKTLDNWTFDRKPIWRKGLQLSMAWTLNRNTGHYTGISGQLSNG